MLEREIKLKLDSAEMATKILDRMNFLYGNPTSEEHQRDEYYDRADGFLKRQDFVVRLRIIDMTRVLFALKGHRIFLENASSERVELEFQYPHEADVRRQLAAQGFVLTAVYEKRRIEWRLKDRIISFDTVPILGDFLEIEVLSEVSVDDTMRELGVSSDSAITSNYSELLREALVHQGVSVEPVLRAEF